MRRLIAAYENGNYRVKLFSDGTKVRSTEDDEFICEFPDSIDLKITDYCDLSCPMCHERSSTLGHEGDLCAEFLNTLRPGTEVAIGGGNPLSHTGLIPFLMRMRRRGVICNLTLNGVHLLRSRDTVEELLSSGLIHGLGISVSHYDPETVEFAESHENTVLHLINGVYSDLEALYGRGLKILILGYKRFGRGADFYSDAVEEGISKMRELLPTLQDKFESISFDNLALLQLGVRELIGEEKFSEMYMGDDGESTMYVDLAGREFARSSTSEERYALLDDIVEMFNKIRKTHK